MSLTKIKNFFLFGLTQYSTMELHMIFIELIKFFYIIFSMLKIWYGKKNENEKLTIWIEWFNKIFNSFFKVPFFFNYIIYN